MSDALREPRVHPGRPPDPAARAAAHVRNPIRRFLLLLGPGLITGASDDDPSGIGTYAQAGAQFGYGTLWATIAMLPMMVTVQYVSAKIGLVTGRGLAGVIRRRYHPALVYPVVGGLVVANTVNAGADIAAIAAALQLIVPLPAVVFVIPVTAGILALQVFGSYALIARVFKWLALALLAYVGAALFARPELGAVLAGTLIPTVRIDPAYLGILVALLGTTISPYLFFWQADQEVEEEIRLGRKLPWQREGATTSELRSALVDTVGGMVFSEVVAYFIILATGATLFVHGHHNVASATDAAQALRPIAGDLSALLLAIGLAGAGILAVPVLTGSAAYGMSEAFGWRSGLDRPAARAKRFYAAITGATVVAMGIALFAADPMAALVIAAVINGLLAPPILVIVMRISGDRQVMGHRANGRLTRAIGWATTLVMALAAVALIVTTVLG